MTGPGLASTYYYQVSPDLALLALQAKLDFMILEQYRSVMTSKINAPKHRLRELYHKMFHAFGATTQESHPFWVDMTKIQESLEKELYEALQEKTKHVIKI